MQTKVTGASVRLFRAAASLLGVAIAVAMTFLASTQAASGASGPRISPDPSIARSGRLCYALESSGDPAIVVIDGDVEQAHLSNRGRTASWYRAGYGGAPLGHGIPSFPLIASNSVANLCVSGIGFRIRTMADTPELRAAVEAGRFGGLYLGVMLTILLIQIGIVAVTRERTAAWYLLFVLSLLWCEIAREGHLAFAALVGADAAFILSDTAVAITVSAFIIEFLNLRQTNRQLYRWLMISVGSLIGLLCVEVVPALSPTFSVVVIWVNALGILSLMAVTVYRGASGYRPALFLLAGLCGMVVQNWYVLLRLYFVFSSPLIDRWAFEAGSGIDAVLLAAALALRIRESVRESARMERELQAASFAAEHDALTGIENRRGLEEWYANAAPRERTIFFIDLDHFKAVNDRGGHAAGDRTLRAVAKVLAALLRADDVAARIGGDEFVLVIATTQPDRVVAITEAICNRIAEMRPLDDDATRIGASVGTAVLKPGALLADVLRFADERAYAMKVEHHGGTPMHDGQVPIEGARRRLPGVGPSTLRGSARRATAPASPGANSSSQDGRG